MNPSITVTIHPHQPGCIVADQLRRCLVQQIRKPRLHPGWPNTSAAIRIRQRLRRAKPEIFRDRMSNLIQKFLSTNSSNVDWRRNGLGLTGRNWKICFKCNKVILNPFTSFILMSYTSRSGILQSIWFQTLVSLVLFLRFCINVSYLLDLNHRRLV